MRRLVMVALGLLCAPLFATAHPGCVLASRHGQLHLVTAGGETGIKLDLEPHWAWEGVFSHVVMEETPYGATIRATLDISGPDWLHLDLDQGESGVTLHVWHSTPSQFDQTWTFKNYTDLTNSRIVAVPYLLTVLARTSDRVIDLDAMQQPPAPMDEARIARAKKLLVQLNDNRWSVREAASLELHTTPYRDHLDELTRGTRLTAEQLMRLSDVLDQPSIVIAPNLLEGVMALCRNED